MTDRRIALASLVVGLAALVLVASLALRPEPELDTIEIDLLDIGGRLGEIEATLDEIEATLDELAGPGPSPDPAIVESLDAIEADLATLSQRLDVGLTGLDRDLDRLRSTVDRLCDAIEADLGCVSSP